MKTGLIWASALALCVNSFAVTSQFRGVNWADKRDNFVSGVLVLSGLSLSDNYQSASVVAERVIGQFQELLGTNSVRMPVNEPTILNAFDMYSGALDVALKHGRLVMGYWGPSQPSGPKNMDDWWKMWGKLVEKYGDHPNAYFEIMNEPHMYNKDQLRSGFRNSRKYRATISFWTAREWRRTCLISPTIPGLTDAFSRFTNTPSGT